MKNKHMELLKRIDLDLMPAQEVIEWLEEEKERGECSISTLAKVAHHLMKTNPKLFKKLNDNYVKFYNGKIDELDQDIFNEVIKYLKTLN